MKKIIAVLCLMFIACSSDDNARTNKEEIGSTIVGSWLFTGGGLVFEDGSEEVLDSNCSNSQKYRFFQGGTFEVEIWWNIDGVCTFDLIRDGNWIGATNDDFPDSNYRLRFFKIPEDEEEIGYPEITFKGSNLMRIQYEWNSGAIEGVTHSYKEYIRE